MSLPKTMRAVICEREGPPSTLVEHRIPLPTPQLGQVLIKVLGFGLNRGEMLSRLGQGHIAFPQILGIECFGIIAGCHVSETTQPVPIGTRVFTCMGGLGRFMPGSYAEYTCVAIENIREVPPTSLSVAQLSALPEMLQATWGALTAGLDVQPGDTVLIRGATSSIGLCAIQLARKLGASHVAATTRSSDRIQLLKHAGADEVFVDNGNISDSLKGRGGFHRVVELVGTSALRDSILCATQKGTVCCVGNQSGGPWTMEGFSPFFLGLPNRVRLCAYGGGIEDLHSVPLEDLLKDVEAGRLKVPINVFRLDEIQEAHRMMEKGGGGAKMVVVLE
ncbi:putative zinc-binding oxidoreductase [Thelonectria olida]|uniref:Zinc-binding oxidoreductase n=1 Tax=Thelonectria olida TaxID=1576542 RepID=A0A9P8VXB8_9HYPO|nr:putative zinc-binding oxidoreductase [Thelonectria olida]